MNLSPITCKITTEAGDEIVFKVASFHHDVSNEKSPISKETGNHPHHGAVSLVKEQDNATVPLYQACLEGVLLTKVEITWSKSVGNESQVYFTHTFEGGVLSSISTDASYGGSPNVTPVEHLVIQYTKATWLHADGNLTFEQDWHELATAM